MLSRITGNEYGVDRLQQRQGQPPAVDRLVSSFTSFRSWGTQLGLMWLGDVAGYSARALLRRRGVQLAGGLLAAQILADEVTTSVVTANFRTEDRGAEALGYEVAEGLATRSFLMGGMVFLKPKSIVTKGLALGLLLTIGGMLSEAATEQWGSKEARTPRTWEGFWWRLANVGTLVLQGVIMKGGFSKVGLDSDDLGRRFEEKVAYWSSEVSVDPVLDLTQAGRSNEIPPPPEQMDTAIQWRDRVIATDLNIKGEDTNPNNGVLLLREMMIPRPARGEQKMAAWLVAVPTDGDGKITPDMEKQALILASYLGPFVDDPIRSIQIHDGAVRPMIDFEQYDPLKKSHVRRSADVVDHWEVAEAGPTHDFLHSMAYVLDTVYEAKMGAYALKFVDARYANFSNTADSAYTTMMSGPFRLFYGELLRLQEFLVSSPVLRNDLVRLDPDDADIIQVVCNQLAPIHRFTAAQAADEVTTFGRLETEFAAHLKAFLIDGKPMGGMLGLKGALAAEPDGAKREALYRAACRHGEAFHARSGNLYDAIPRLNRYAQAAGLPDYVDHAFLFRFGFTGPDFAQRMAKVMEATEAQSREYIAQLAQLKKELVPESDGTVCAWDVDYLQKIWMERLLGGKEPTLTYEEAITVVKAVYRDLGVDLDHPPYSKIVMDNFRREGKTENYGMAVPALLNRAYFTSNMAPAGEIPLRQLVTLLHETGHCVNYLAQGETANGHFCLAGEYFPYHWAEGIASTLGDIPFHSLLAKRHLGRFSDKFNDQYFAASAQIFPLKSAFELREYFLHAWMEVNLYRDTLSIEDRRAVWAKKAREVLGVVEAEDGLGMWALRPHYTYKDYHLYMPAYFIARPVTDGMLDRAIADHGVEGGLSHFGGWMLTMMQKGARLSQSDLDEAEISLGKEKARGEV